MSAGTTPTKKMVKEAAAEDKAEDSEVAQVVAAAEEVAVGSPRKEAETITRGIRP